jgi:hypothetical protein
MKEAFVRVRRSLYEVGRREKERRGRLAPGWEVMVGLIEGGALLLSAFRRFSLGGPDFIQNPPESSAPC